MVGRTWRTILDRRRDEILGAFARISEGAEALPPSHIALLDALSAAPPTAMVDGVPVVHNLADADAVAHIQRLRDVVLARLPDDAGREERDDVRRAADDLVTAVLRDRERRRRRRAATSEAGRLARAHDQRLQALGQLSAAVAHSFNNLLTVITGYASTLEMSPQLGTLELRAATAIASAAAQAATMTRRLVRASRPEAAPLGPLQTLPFLAEAREVLNSVMGRSISVQVLAEQDLPPLSCEANGLLDALLLLTANAREAMPAGGTLILSVYMETERDDQAAVVIEVQDDGEGIPPDCLSRVFEPGFSTRSRPDAAGLGCARVRSIVEDAGGSVKVDSTPGEGTRFLLYLPIAAGATQPQG